ncbi:serine hydrolase domain-containing protein [Pedobacter terrae]|uniref:serine hydrolase domain-containing protein n=1 Tax=Pedobacter terrae TaxID=405671 RepID=UPI002FFC54FF
MRRIFLLIAIGLLLSNLTFGQSVQCKQLDSLFNALFKEKMFHGNVLIADKGKILFEKSYGFANEKTGQKINNRTIFELASVSKQFTAIGIVLLAKRGKLNYDDKISKYIPELSFYGNISIRNLLNHTGGLPDYMEIFEEKWDKKKLPPIRILLMYSLNTDRKLFFNQAKNTCTAIQGTLY